MWRHEITIFINPTGQVRGRRTDGRLRPHRPQDHRRHLRRHGPPRRRRVQRQGPVQGRPLGLLRRAVGGQERRGGRASPPRCEVQVAYAIGVARPVSVMVDTFGTETRSPVADRAVGAGELRPASGGHHRARWTCAARSTRRRRRMATSGATTPTSRGSAPIGERSRRRELAKRALVAALSVLGAACDDRAPRPRPPGRLAACGRAAAAQVQLCWSRRAPSTGPSTTPCPPPSTGPRARARWWRARWGPARVLGVVRRRGARRRTRGAWRRWPGPWPRRRSRPRSWTWPAGWRATTRPRSPRACGWCCRPASRARCAGTPTAAGPSRRPGRPPPRGWSPARRAQAGSARQREILDALRAGGGELPAAELCRPRGHHAAHAAAHGRRRADAPRGGARALRPRLVRRRRPRATPARPARPPSRPRPSPRSTAALEAGGAPCCCTASPARARPRCTCGHRGGPRARARTSLVLVPEIALTPQLLGRLRGAARRARRRVALGPGPAAERVAEDRRIRDGRGRRGARRAQRRVRAASPTWG